MKRAGDMVVPRSMIVGAIFYCIFAIAPHLLKVKYNSDILEAITDGVGWNGYLLGLGFFISFIVGLFRHEKNYWFPEE